MQTICIKFAVFLQKRLKLSYSAEFRVLFKTFALLCKIAQNADFWHFSMQKRKHYCIKRCHLCKFALKNRLFLLIYIPVAEAEEIQY